MGTFTSKVQDQAIPDATGGFTLSGAQLSARETIIAWDVFEGATLDTGRWGSSTGSGGSVTQSNGITLATSTNSAGSASITSAFIPCFMPSAEIVVRAHVRLGTSLIADCSRELLAVAVDGSNFARFRADDLDFYCELQADGSIVDSVVGVSETPTNFMDLEIRILPTAVYFVCNGKQAASFSSRGSTLPLWASGVASQIRFSVANSGDTTDNTLELRSMIVTRRFEAMPGQIRVKKLTADGIVSRGPCWYLGCRRIGTTTGAAKIYHGVAAGSDPAAIIDEYDADGIPMAPLPGPIECYDGIYVDLTTDALLVYYID